MILVLASLTVGAVIGWAAGFPLGKQHGYWEGWEAAKQLRTKGERP